MSDLRFTEIEHKFVVDEQCDIEALRRVLDAVSPNRHVTLRVRDRYFITEAGRTRGFILRHRHDRELHELTVKTVAADAEVREEVNLALRPGDQDATVDAFVQAQGLVWAGELWKDLEVWHFEDCEVVYYTAQAGERVVHCVEFEATRKESLTDALTVLARYEKAAGFGSHTRTQASLLELVWPQVMVEMGWQH